MSFDGELKLFETLISCGFQDVFDLQNGEAKARLRRQVNVFIC